MDRQELLLELYDNPGQGSTRMYSADEVEELTSLRTEGMVLFCSERAQWLLSTHGAVHIEKEYYGLAEPDEDIDRAEYDYDDYDDYHMDDDQYPEYC